MLKGEDGNAAIRALSLRRSFSPLVLANITGARQQASHFVCMSIRLWDRHAMA
jgi:hypothetical protein